MLLFFVYRPARVWLVGFRWLGCWGEMLGVFFGVKFLLGGSTTCIDLSKCHLPSGKRSHSWLEYPHVLIGSIHRLNPGPLSSFRYVNCGSSRPFPSLPGEYLLRFLVVCLVCFFGGSKYMGVSKNNGTPKSSHV